MTDNERDRRLCQDLQTLVWNLVITKNKNANI